MKLPSIPSSKQTPNPLQLTGRLELRTFYANTRKSFTGIYIVTEKAAYLIRPARLPASGDNPLQALLGKMVTATGQLKHEVFLADQVVDKENE
ncbi:hypothetical protein F0L74_14750 [Chitinophaga agrisoli]|uniref:Uncharacterized protein n=1 Tax=Chitinophaga agrisoli TaxID=2607653 RepID=A0A5B2VXC4_9BACT|nr:hypothetical protein [Chitinophaga agrisoli]KAA2243735.1 hypothetical protein F0L74_14750 [Chitinophaga agrisoli]